MHDATSGILRTPTGANLESVWSVVTRENKLQRWARIEALLDQVIELPAADRRRSLDEACAGDSELRAEVLAAGC